MYRTVLWRLVCSRVLRARHLAGYLIRHVCRCIVRFEPRLSYLSPNRRTVCRTKRVIISTDQPTRKDTCHWLRLKASQGCLRHRDKEVQLAASSSPQSYRCGEAGDVGEHQRPESTRQLWRQAAGGLILILQNQTTAGHRRQGWIRGVHLMPVCRVQGTRSSPNVTEADGKVPSFLFAVCNAGNLRWKEES